MEVVNENVRSKSKILDYLKSLNVEANNYHIEIELDNILISVIKLSSNTTTLTSKTYKYSVSLLCIDKTNNNVYDNILLKEFNSEKEADTYFNELIDKINNTNEEKLKNLIMTYQLG